LPTTAMSGFPSMARSGDCTSPDSGGPMAMPSSELPLVVFDAVSDAVVDVEVARPWSSGASVVSPLQPATQSNTRAPSDPNPHFSREPTEFNAASAQGWGQQ